MGLSEEDAERAVEVVVKVLMEHLDITTDAEGVRRICRDLEWPEPSEDWDCGLWVVDGASPRELAEQVVAALKVRVESPRVEGDSKSSR